jgi:hypothetical protein
MSLTKGTGLWTSFFCLIDVRGIGWERGALGVGFNARYVAPRRVGTGMGSPTHRGYIALGDGPAAQPITRALIEFDQA